MPECLRRDQAWMATHGLCLNDEKTELLLVGSPNNLSKLSPCYNNIIIDGNTIPIVKSVKTLGFHLDANTNLSKQINATASATAYTGSERAAAPYRNDALVMSPVNNTEITPLSFILTGIPGLEAYHIWFAPPLCFIYNVTLLGNSVLILAIKTTPSLHRPMYLFISQLALCDLAASSCIVPKMLSIFWFKSGEINFTACLIQMFCVTAVTALESAILSAMAFDRYAAICNPLRYSAIMTNSLIAKIAVASVTRAIVLCAPLQFITTRLPFCSSHVSHTYCENMAVSGLSCSDPTANSMYGLAASTLIGAMDILCIALSYILILKTVLHFQHTKDSVKAISTCSAHICIIAASYIPFFFSVVVSRLRKSLPIYVHVIVVNLYLILPPLLNPIIYGMTMKETVVSSATKSFFKSRTPYFVSPFTLQMILLEPPFK
ncbi:olfactory receptor 52P1-like [Ambystoma mexicanum]|uniref:olfactory receptor 52P1-like n=1 Tax=Ambystoma mexicanum TaxID=8296 RepID=UPI0037E85AE5